MESYHHPLHYPLPGKGHHLVGHTGKRLFTSNRSPWSKVLAAFNYKGGHTYLECTEGLEVVVCVELIGGGLGPEPQQHHVLAGRRVAAVADRREGARALDGELRSCAPRPRREKHSKNVRRMCVYARTTELWLRQILAIQERALRACAQT